MIKTKYPVKKIITIGDLHFGAKNNNGRIHINIKDCIRDFIIPIIKRTIDESGGTDGIYICLMGDICDDKQQIVAEIYTDITSIIFELSRLLPTIILIGNHDTPMTEMVEINNLKPFKYIDNVELVEREIFTIPTVLGENNDFDFLSWNKNKLHILNQIEKTKSSSKFCFTHLSIAGFVYDGKPINESKHISLDDIGHYKTVISGHIHNYQKSKNTTYVGIPLQISESDHKIENPGVIIFDVENNTQTFIENKISPRYINVGYEFHDSVDVTNRYVTVICGIKNYSKIDFDGIRIKLIEKGAIMVNFEQQFVNHTGATIREGAVIDTNGEPIIFNLTEKFEQLIDVTDVVPISKSEKYNLEATDKDRLKSSVRTFVRESELITKDLDLES